MGKGSCRHSSVEVPAYHRPLLLTLLVVVDPVRSMVKANTTSQQQVMKQRTGPHLRGGGGTLHQKRDLTLVWRMLLISAVARKRDNKLIG
jgi:hypothetical protein